MRKRKVLLAGAMISVLAISQAASVMAANSPGTGMEISGRYQERMGLTTSTGSSTGALNSSTSALNDVLTVEEGQSVTGQEGSTTVTLDSRGQAVVGDTALELVQGGGATVGLPETVLSTISGINSGNNLNETVPGVDLTGYNALIGTHAIMTREVGTAVEKLGSVQVPLYVPNLIDGLGTVQVLYFNNHTGRWELITPSRIDTASKTLWVTLPGSGTLTVVYRR